VGTGLLLELTPGDDEGILAFRIFSLRNRPGARVLLGPERTTGMHEQNLELAGAATVEQNSGTAFGHPVLRAGGSQAIVAGDRAGPLDGNRGIGRSTQRQRRARRWAFEAAVEPIAKTRRRRKIHVDRAANDRGNVEVGDAELVT